MSAELAVLQQLKNSVSRIGEIKEFDTPLETFTINGETWIKNGNYVESTHSLAKTVDIGAWTGVSSPYIPSTITSMAENDDGSIIVGVKGSEIVYSTNSGTSWLSANVFAGQTVLKVVFGNGVFVALVAGTTASTRIYTSTSGSSWTARTSVNSDHNDIDFGEGYFAVALSSGTTSCVIYSSDGVTWTTTTVVGITNAYRIKYVKERKVWVIANNTNIATATRINATLPASVSITTQIQTVSGSIFYFDGYIYTYANNSGQPTFYRSLGDNIWTRYENSKLSFLSQTGLNILNVNGLLVFVIGSLPPYLLYSADFNNFYATETLPFPTCSCFFAQKNGTVWSSGNGTPYLAKATQIKGFALPFDGSKKFMRVA